MSTRRAYGSEYLLWAKTRSGARFNLATSGVPNLPFAELPVTLADLEITTTEAYGHAPLLEAIAAKSGVEVENVVTAAGTSMANHLAMAALLEPGDDVVMERPVYDPILSAVRYLGANVRFLERNAANDFALDVGEMERLLTPRTRLVVLTNLHNPTGALADAATLEAVATAARRVGARLLVDEVYLDAVFDDTPRSAFHLAPDVVVTSSLTKVYGVSGLRCGWILADRETARRMWLLNDLFAASPVYAAERMSVVAFGQLEPLARRGRRMLDANRRVLHEFFDERPELVAPRFAWGTTSFPRVVGVPVDELCAHLRERYETTVVPGAFFGRPDHVRIGLACDPAVFEGGLERLAAALDDLERR